MGAVACIVWPESLDQPSGKVSRLPLCSACADADCDALTSCNAGSCQGKRRESAHKWRRASAVSTLRSASSLFGRTKEACPRGCDSIKWATAVHPLPRISLPCQSKTGSAHQCRFRSLTIAKSFESFVRETLLSLLPPDCKRSLYTSHYFQEMLTFFLFMLCDPVFTSQYTRSPQP